ncbi:MAG: hypothetical protein ACK4RF_00125 [Cyclobacteriaceae bacterium]
MSKLITVFILLVCQPGFTQIGSKAQSGKPTGTWVNNQFGYQMMLILNEDGTGEFDGEMIRYTITGNKLSITQAAIATQYTFSVAAATLTLSGGDIDGTITFNRLTAGNEGTKSTPVQAQSNSTINPAILGTWSGYGETIEFRADGQCNYRGEQFTYRIAGKSIVLQTPLGDAALEYQVNNNQLVLTANGQTFTYTKSAASSVSSLGGKARVAPELVGKWCFVNVYSNSSGGSSTEKCLTLNADGTYEYYGETSRSVNTDAFYGGTNSQSVDRGTWTYDGVRIQYVSQTGRGSGSYTLEKRNHPKNNDPMIVLDGETYVTQYQKAPW